LETIAVYWEPIIQTYGFLEKTGLSLFKISFPADRIADWGLRIQEMAITGDGFLLAFGQIVNRETLQIDLLFEKKWVDRIQAALGKWAADEPHTWLRVEAPVELIYFHGPHYGDRYGIADAALTSLVLQGVPILAMACTGATVYLILPEGKTRLAREALGQAFMTPETGKQETGK
jgi:hypothetical protein